MNNLLEIFNFSKPTVSKKINRDGTILYRFLRNEDYKIRFFDNTLYFNGSRIFLLGFTPNETDVFIKLMSFRYNNVFFKKNWYYTSEEYVNINNNTINSVEFVFNNINKKISFKISFIFRNIYSSSVIKIKNIDLNFNIEFNESNYHIIYEKLKEIDFLK